MTAYGPMPGQYPYQYPPQQYPPQPPPPVNPAVLVGVSLWRLVIIGSALYGFSEATGWTENLDALSQQASLFTGVVYIGLLLYPAFTGGRRHEPVSPWLRGATTVLLLLVSGAFFGLLGGGFDDQPFEHAVTPLLVLLDWLFVGRNQVAAKWWHPLTWLGFPLAYFVYFLGAEVYQYLYPFLDPDNEEFPLVVGGLIVALIVVGYLLVGVAKLRGVVGRPDQPGAHQQPNAYSAPGWMR
ncbi:Pr6Pr family membrane protein [Actinophytocola sediminis]